MVRESNFLHPVSCRYCGSGDHVKYKYQPLQYSCPLNCPSGGTIAPQQLRGIRIMDHTLWWSDIEMQIKGIQGDQVNIHQKIAAVTSHSPP